MLNTPHISTRRVLIADDNREIRNAVISLIEREFEVVGTVSDGEDLIEAASNLKPNIGIIDISMPIMSGIEAVAEIRKSGSPMKFVFLTVSEDADFVSAALAAGATGYVIKRNMVTELVKALKEAESGRTFISPCCEISSLKNLTYD